MLGVKAMNESPGNAEQTRAIIEQVAETLFYKFEREHPVKTEAAIPAPLKWAATIVAALFVVGIAGLVFWLVTSVSGMQLTLARMDERMGSGMVKDSRFDDIDRRVIKLEAYSAGGGK